VGEEKIRVLPVCVSVYECVCVTVCLNMGEFVCENV
jgi:hypothetical protein